MSLESIEISDFVDNSLKITSDVIFINVKHSVEQGSLAWQAKQCWLNMSSNFSLPLDV